MYRQKHLALDSRCGDTKLDESHKLLIMTKRPRHIIPVHVREKFPVKKLESGAKNLLSTGRPADTLCGAGQRGQSCRRGAHTGTKSSPRGQKMTSFILLPRVRIRYINIAQGLMFRSPWAGHQSIWLLSYKFYLSWIVRLEKFLSMFCWIIVLI